MDELRQKTNKALVDDLVVKLLDSVMELQKMGTENNEKVHDLAEKIKEQAKQLEVLSGRMDEVEKKKIQVPKIFSEIGSNVRTASASLIAGGLIVLGVTSWEEVRNYFISLLGAG